MRTSSLILLSLCLFGCEKSAVSPSFPTATQVSQLNIFNKRSGGGEIVSIFTEQSKIAELFADLGKIKGGWSYTSSTYPTPQAQIFFVGTSGPLCRLDIDPSWVGSDCGVELKSNWPPLVGISREQALFFRNFVAGTWDVK
jgi:hypothetical protein